MDVLQWSMEEVAIVAAYCELEAESFKSGGGGSSVKTPPPRAAQEVVHTQTWAVQPKRK